MVLPPPGSLEAMLQARQAALRAGTLQPGMTFVQRPVGGGPLLAAAKARNWTAMQAALSEGADPDARDSFGISALAECCSQGGSIDGVRLLLAAGAFVDCIDDEGATPLKFACDRGGIRTPNSAQDCL